MKNVNWGDVLTKNGFMFKIIHNDIPIRTTKKGTDYFKIDIAQIALTLIIYTGIGLLC